jgi:S-adenosylmethionine:tRNA ribosyltransferase-isomerase
MKLSEFDFPLPRDRIAQEPAEPRDAARLMTLDRRTGAREHRVFRELPEILRPGDLVVLNDTRVLPARLVGARATGGRVELLLVSRRSGSVWECWIDSSRRPRPDERLEFRGGLSGRVLQRNDAGGWLVDFGPGADAGIEAAGTAPLPPYIRRPDGPTERDRERYQTVYAREPGSIAAPTAGLHFTAEVLAGLSARGVQTAALTLHVGPGTFRPVSAETVEEHRMDPERYSAPAPTREAVARARAEGRRVVAVGTTCARALESLARGAPPEGATDLFIYPGFEFRAVDALLTNFHLPRGTPLLLACAWAGRERLLAAYAEALERGYRFFSYGDAMLIG